MIQCGDHARFTLEALAELLGTDLDRDDAIKPRIARLPHLPHAARTDRRKDFVRAKAAAAGQAHECHIIVLLIVSGNAAEEFGYGEPSCELSADRRTYGTLGRLSFWDCFRAVAQR